MSKSIKNIAVMRLSAMGDVAMTVPIIRTFVAQNPTIKIIFISRPFFKPLFDGIQNVTFFAFDDKNKHKGFFGLLRLYIDLKRLKIDAFADLHNVLRSKIVRNLFSFSGIKTAFTDKGRKDKKALTQLEHKIFKQLPTVFDRHKKVFEKFGFSIDLSKNEFPEKTFLNPDLFYKIAPTPLDFSKKIIGIAPFAQYESKTYPLDLMQKVIDDLSINQNNILLLFGGGKKEIEILNTISETKKNIICIAGKITFSEELQLISNLDLMLAMDSGNAHLAAMFGIKTITLWGATHPHAGFSPFNQPNDNAITSNRSLFPMLPTSIYGNKKVMGYENAMRTITVYEVVKTVNQNLQSKPKLKTL